MSFEPPSWRGQRVPKSRGDRILGSIVGLAVLLVVVVAAFVALNQAGGLEGVLAQLGFLPPR